MKIGPLVVAGLLAAYLVLRWRRLQLENRILGVVAVIARPPGWPRGPGSPGCR